MLPNFENFFVGQTALHARMGTLLCKQRACAKLMALYAADPGGIGGGASSSGSTSSSNATIKATTTNPTTANATTVVRFMGHTSLDPRVGYETLPLRFDAAIHVKGKSPHKYTGALLICYRNHPEFPPLTVVGQASITEIALKPKQVTLLPKPPDGPSAGVHKLNMGGAQINRELITFDALRRLQNGAGVHVCVSEREGFGHYINEARAVGAFVISTDHPPMNELITPERGALVKPTRVE